MSGQAQSQRIPAGLNLRYWQIAGAAVLTAASALLVRESVILGAGWTPAGPDAGFFPLWVSAIMLVSSAIILVSAIRSAKPGMLFESLEAGVEVLKVGLPLAAAIFALPYLGYYLTAGLYVGAFSKWYGRHRWAVSLGFGVALPVIMFFGFERGFKLPMPKSMFYGDFIPF